MGKTPGFAGLHMGVAFAAGYAMTGSLWVGGALALVEPASNTVVFHVHEDVHEKVWRRIETCPSGIALSA